MITENKHFRIGDTVLLVKKTKTAVHLEKVILKEIKCFNDKFHYIVKNDVFREPFGVDEDRIIAPQMLFENFLENWLWRE